ncbi:MAG: DUF5309 family protein [Planctomycetes bacterium]|nr:DUF5309 family protein [Planctomycetota bacterium]
MSFNGKASYDAGATLPEMVDDLADVIGLISPHETPLLNAIGIARNVARSTRHEWLEDALRPLSSQVNFGPGYVGGDTSIAVDDGGVFRVGDILRPEGSNEVLQVSSISTNTLTVVRGYGSTTAGDIDDNTELTVIGHAALEGEDAAPSVTTNRSRLENFTQIFTETVTISGSLNAANLHGIENEFSYQVINRSRELMRQLEQSVISGVKAASTPYGSASVRRTMGGLLSFISGSNAVVEDASAAALDEELLNNAIRACWEKGGRPNAIVVNGIQKRAISGFISAANQYVSGEERLQSMINTYESDFGVQRVILSRWVPRDKVLLLDLDKIQVLPLAGRSFHAKELATTGDFRRAQILGEYTLEVLNASDGGHGVITNLATS